MRLPTLPTTRPACSRARQAKGSSASVIVAPVQPRFGRAWAAMRTLELLAAWFAGLCSYLADGSLGPPELWTFWS